jgi:hypothetical protein
MHADATQGCGRPRLPSPFGRESFRCRIFSVPNLWTSNPTLTIVALALRLADKVPHVLQKSLSVRRVNACEAEKKNSALNSADLHSLPTCFQGAQHAAATLCRAATTPLLLLEASAAVAPHTDPAAPPRNAPMMPPMTEAIARAI